MRYYRNVRPFAVWCIPVVNLTVEDRFDSQLTSSMPVLRTMYRFLNATNYIT